MGLDLARLRAARERLGLTQIELSEALGLSKGAFSDYERGTKAPTLVSLKRMSALLEVSVDWLLGGEESEKLSKHARNEADCLPVGLLDFHADETLMAALEPTAAEMLALRSLEYPGGLTKDGYIALLIVLRTASVEAMRLRLTIAQRSQVHKDVNH